MSHLTDDELGTLLTETFAAREHLAEPEAAVRIAARVERPRSRRLAGLAAAAAVVVGVGTAVALGGGNDGVAPAPLAPTPAPSSGPSLAENRAEALRVSEQTIARVKVMEGAIRTSGGAFTPTDGLLLGDASLSRDAWYSFGADPRAVERFLLRNPPPGMKVFDFESALSSMPHPTVKDAPGGVRYLTYVPRSSAPNAAYQGPNVLVQWKGLSGTTAVRFSTSISAREPRAQESRIVRNGSAEVRLFRLTFYGDGTSTSTPVDLDLPGQLRLLGIVDRLVGSVEHPQTHSCSAQEKSTRYAIVVRSGSGSPVTFSVDEPGCGEAVVEVRRDGRLLAGTLDPWPLYEPLEQAFQRR